MAKKSKIMKVKVVNDGPELASKPDDDWEHRRNAEKLQEAGEILADPEKLKKAQKHLKKQKKAMRSIQDLISHRNAKFGANAEAEAAEEAD